MKKDKFVNIFLILLLCYCQSIIAQGNQNSTINQKFEYFKIETPNAASFTKYIDNPINLYNGSTDVNIPLYTLQDGQIQLPIDLRYNTSGIKVQEEASWVGLGWNLNVGGVITKNVVGEADEFDVHPSYNNFIAKKFVTPFMEDEIQVRGHYWHEFTLDLLNYFETALQVNNSFGMRLGKLTPDVYNFSYPGGAGRFIFDYRNDSIIILNRESNIRIIQEKGTGYDFRIITTEGVQHLFQKLTTEWNSNGSAIYPISINYVLKETVYPNKEKVNYTYDTYRYVKKDYVESVSMTPSHASTSPYEPSLPQNHVFANGSTWSQNFNNKNNGISAERNGSEFVLTQISTPNYSIQFENSQREDLKDGKKLDKIIIQAKNNSPDKKIINLQYDYFKGTETPRYYKDASNRDLKRLKLTNLVDFQGGVYKFDYSRTPISSIYSYNMDYWGYFKNSNNWTFLPRVSEIQPNRTYTDQQYKLEETNMNRRASEEEASKAGILERIQYPTGGYTSLSYESNSWSNTEIIPSEDGFKSKYVRKFSGSAEFGLSKATKIEFTLNKKEDLTWRFTITKGDKNNWYDVAWKHSVRFNKIVNGKEEMVNRKLYNLKDECETLYNNNLTFIPDISFSETIRLEPGSYVIHLTIGPQDAPFPNMIGASIRAEGNVMEYQYESETESKGCGLRINNIQKYASDGSLLSQTNYTYALGVLHNFPNFMSINKAVYSITQNGSGGTTVGGYPTSYIFGITQTDITQSIQGTNPYSSVGSVGYSEVKEHLFEGSQNGTTVYEFNNTAPKRMENSIDIHSPLNGKLEKKIDYDSTNNIIKYESFKYSEIKEHAYWGANLVNPLNRNPAISSGWSGYYPDWLYRENSAYLYPPYFLFYAIDSYRIQLQEKEVFHDGVKNKEIYTYNPNTLQLTSKTSKTSDNQDVLFKYKYPNDYSCGVYKDMSDKNIISPVIEELQFKNKSIVGGKLTQYGYDQSLIVPKQYSLAQPKTSSANPQTFTCAGINKDVYPLNDITYDLYDNRGNILQYTGKDNISVVYIWSYFGQYPIAQIINSTYGDVEKALGVDLNSISKQAIPDMVLINGLRSKLSNALITTYTYKPLVGILTATDPMGITTYYEYDSFGRLTRTYIKEKDEKGLYVEKIIQAYEYNYSNK